MYIKSLSSVDFNVKLLFIIYLKNKTFVRQEGGMGRARTQVLRRQAVEGQSNTVARRGARSAAIAPRAFTHSYKY